MDEKILKLMQFQTEALENIATELKNIRQILQDVTVEDGVPNAKRLHVCAQSYDN